MTYLVVALPTNIDFAPSSVVEEVLQNVRTIISTPKYSVPLFREFGTTGTYVDDPINFAKAKITAELVTIIPKYEPRAQVKKVTFTGDGLTGKLMPRVEVNIIGN